MSIFQLFAALFALFMVYWVRTSHKRRQLSLLEASFWYSVWSVFILLSVFPNLLLGVAQTLHFARVFDLLVVLAFTVLTIQNFYLYLKNKKLEQKLETLARKMAMKQQL